jgi:hypothetical protein
MQGRTCEEEKWEEDNQVVKTVTCRNCQPRPSAEFPGRRNFSISLHLNKSRIPVSAGPVRSSTFPLDSGEGSLFEH